jgi:superfamily II DNA helicase RecQ
MENQDDIDSVAQTFGFALKPEQKEAIVSILSRSDTFVQLPTGYGKSLIFQLLPHLFKNHQTSASPSVVLACPLVSLLESHKQGIEKLGMSCCVLGNNVDIKKHYDFIIGTPEAFTKQHYRDWIKNKDVCCFVADEVHTIPKW